MTFNKYKHFQDKQIRLWQNHNDTTKIVYNGSDYYNMKNQVLYDITSRPFEQSFILVKSTRKTPEEMKEEMKEYISNIQEISKLTDNKINMFRTGSISRTALSLFTEINKIKSQPIKEFEFKYLENGGGVRYAQKGYEGEAFKYDINSYYPSLMLSKYIRIPITEGKSIDITTEELEQKRSVKFGVYHADIKCNNDVMFSTMNKNMYSHYEINYAKKLGLKIIVLGPALVWDTEQTIPFYKLFNKYINYLYPLKNKHKKIKIIMNALWGSLCSKNGRSDYKVLMNYEDISTSKHVIKRITPLDNTMTKCEVLIECKTLFYKTSFARMKPFLLGFARVNMHKTFDKIGYDNILWSHTDSIVSKIQLSSQIKLSYKIGDWKYEGKSDNCYVYNKNFMDF